MNKNRLCFQRPSDRRPNQRSQENEQLKEKKIYLD